MKIYINSIVFLVLLVSCSEKETNSTENEVININHLKSVVLKQSKPLFGKFYERFKITGDGEYWIFVDRMRDKIFVFDKEGQYINTISESGRGPRGIVSIDGFDVNENNEVFIYDASQRMLKIYTLDDELISSNNFLEKVNFGTTPLEMLWYEGKVLTSIIENEFMFEPQNSKVLALIKTDGEIDTVFGRFDPFAEHDNTYSFFNNITIDDSSNVVFTSLSSSPFIQVFDLNNFSKESYIGAKNSTFKVPEKEISANLSIDEVNRRSVNTSRAVNLFLTDDYIVQHIQTLTEEWFLTTDYSSKANSLIFYDRITGEIVQEVPVEHSLGSVRDDKLYFIEDFNPDNYTIGVYEIVTDQK